MFSFLQNMSNLQQRVISGLAGAAVVITSISYGRWSYLILFGLICLFTLIEFHKLVSSTVVKTNPVVGAVVGLPLFVFTFCIEKSYVEPKWGLLLIPYWFCLFLIELFQTNEKPFVRLAFYFLGLIYIALPFSMMNLLVIVDGEYTYYLTLGYLFLLWANDIGGYFGGRFFGKHKLYERISPKKTWEGFFSGLIFSQLTAYVFYLFFPEFGLINWLLLSGMVVVIGSLGDLVESQFKRSIEVKDSAASIPGHGGFLDRFDGLFISMPFVAVFFELFRI